MGTVPRTCGGGERDYGKSDRYDTYITVSKRVFEPSWYSIGGSLCLESGHCPSFERTCQLVRNGTRRKKFVELQSWGVEVKIPTFMLATKVSSIYFMHGINFRSISKCVTPPCLLHSSIHFTTERRQTMRRRVSASTWSQPIIIIGNQRIACLHYNFDKKEWSVLVTGVRLQWSLARNETAPCHWGRRRSYYLLPAVSQNQRTLLRFFFEIILRSNIP